MADNLGYTHDTGKTVSTGLAVAWPASTVLMIEASEY